MSAKKVFSWTLTIVGAFIGMFGLFAWLLSDNIVVGLFNSAICILIGVIALAVADWFEINTK